LVVEFIIDNILNSLFIIKLKVRLFYRSNQSFSTLVHWPHGIRIICKLVTSYYLSSCWCLAVTLVGIEGLHHSWLRTCFGHQKVVLEYVSSWSIPICLWCSYFSSCVSHILNKAWLGFVHLTLRGYLFIWVIEPWRSGVGVCAECAIYVLVHNSAIVLVFCLICSMYAINWAAAVGKLASEILLTTWLV